MELTNEQQKIVDARDCNLLVSAAAGSGKTAVLVERIMELIKEGTDVDRLVVVTFTKAAAASMREKIAIRLEAEAAADMFNEHVVKQLSLISKAEITTIDGFCLGLVKDHFNEAGVDANLTICDDAEMTLLKSDVMDELLEEEYRAGDMAFIDLVESFARRESDEKLVDIIYDIYDMSNSFPEPYAWIQNAKDALLTGDMQEIMKLPWMKETLIDIKEKINCCLSLAEFCTSLIEDNEGFDGYAASFYEDFDYFDALAKKPDLIKGIEKQQYIFPNIGRLKGKNYDKDIQNILKAQRDIYKKTYNDCYNLVSSMNCIKDEYAIMGRPLIKLLELAERFDAMLMAEKKSRNSYEFHDIEHMAYRLVCQGHDNDGKAIPSEIGKEISENYDAIMIDEYQDSNFLQEDILTSVSGENRGIHNLFMVGDVKQSIYKFRMVRPDLFIDKYNTYSEDDKEYKKLVLTRNFRSRRTVLDAVNDIFSRLMKNDLGGIDYSDDAYLNFCGLDENFPGEDAPCEFLISDGAKDDAADETDVEAVSVDDECDPEAEMIMARIGQLTSPQGGYRYSDIVVLVRSMKTMGPLMQAAADKCGIPVYIENEGGFFDASEVQTLLAMLSCVDNTYQDYELVAALKSPLAGITSNELAIIAGTYNRDNPELAKKAMFYDKVIYYVNCQERLQGSEGALSESDTELVGKLKTFLGRLDYLKENRQYMSISDMLRYILSETGYYWYVGGMTMGAKRQANIDALISRADAYENSSYKGLFNFLRYIGRMKINSLDFAEPAVSDENENVVRVMTMHKSKGLEFPVVFVSGLGRKINQMSAGGDILMHSDYYLISDAYDPEHRLKRKTFAKAATAACIRRDTLGEELRVLYVAFTRAKDRLILTAKTDNFESLAKRSSVHMLDKDGYLYYTARSKADRYIDWLMRALLAETYISEKTDAQDYLSRKFNIRLIFDDAESRMLPAEPVEVEKETFVEATVLPDTIKARLQRLKTDKAPVYFRSKMSITDIKKMKNAGEENPGYVPYAGAADDRPVLKELQPLHKVSGGMYGTVMHKIMECINFADDSLEQTEADIKNMLELGIIDEACKDMISARCIYDMLKSPLGIRMRRAEADNRLYREKQFYIAMNADDIYESETHAPSDQMVVVQGIIDAYFIEDDEIVLVDYKTDHVEKPEDLVKRYHVQLDEYAKTLEQLNGLKVKEKLIYSFFFNNIIDCSVH